MEKRYRALRFIGSVYKILGIIAGVMTILGVIVICLFSILGSAALGGFTRELGIPGLGASEGIVGGIFAGFLALFYGGLATISLYAMGEAVYLILALEENTRATALWIQRQASPAPAQQYQAPPAAQYASPPSSPPPPPRS